MSHKHTTNPKVSLLYHLVAVALVLALGGVAETAAQWATNVSDINNTNSGNVGVGTTAPASKLHALQLMPQQGWIWLSEFC